MALSITSINSGSNGNCYYLESNAAAVLIDAGISCREIEKRMARQGLSMYKVKALFISHEHSDHIRGVETMAKKYRLPVYITDATLKNSRLNIDHELVRNFESHKPVFIDDLIVQPFSKQHDAADPYSFVVECAGVKVGVFTDIGVVCQNLISYFSQCHTVFLEANYDDAMLTNGAYPWHLKQRIRSNKGHLSNEQALELFRTYKPEFMSHVFLSHLSKENNCPVLVKDLFSAHAGNTSVIVASRDHEMPVYHITTGSASVKEVARHRQLVFQASLNLFTS